MDLSETQVVLRLAAALFFGSCIGLERERLSRPAGLRTHALVCAGAAVAMMVSTYGFHDVQGQASVSIDPSRIGAGVLAGIGFIGAGTIIAQPGSTHGLTTAASLWLVAGLGLAVGGGLYFIAGAGTVTALIVLVPFKYVEDHFLHRHEPPLPPTVPSSPSALSSPGEGAPKA